METIITLIGFVFIVLVHELGHCILPYFKKMNPKIKIRWWGVEVVWDDFENTLLFDQMIISASGIIAGFSFLFPFYKILPEWVFLFYIIGCVMDIWNIFACMITILFKGSKSKVKDCTVEISA